jgi:hypothetical protein
LIATGDTGVSLAAKAATTTIPIVFVSGGDAIDRGLVSNLSRPDANLTGVNLFSNVITSKRVQLLHELVPAGASLAMLMNSTDPKGVEQEIRDAETIMSLTSWSGSQGPLMFNHAVLRRPASCFDRRIRSRLPRRQLRPLPLCSAP